MRTIVAPLSAGGARGARRARPQTRRDRAPLHPPAGAGAARAEARGQFPRLARGMPAGNPRIKRGPLAARPPGWPAPDWIMCRSAAVPAAPTGDGGGSRARVSSVARRAPSLAQRRRAATRRRAARSKPRRPRPRVWPFAGGRRAELPARTSATRSDARARARAPALGVALGHPQLALDPLAVGRHLLAQAPALALGVALRRAQPARDARARQPNAALRIRTSARAAPLELLELPLRAAARRRQFDERLGGRADALARLHGDAELHERRALSRPGQLPHATDERALSSATQLRRMPQRAQRADADAAAHAPAGGTDRLPRRDGRTRGPDVVVVVVLCGPWRVVSPSALREAKRYGPSGDRTEPPHPRACPRPQHSANVRTCPATRPSPSACAAGHSGVRGRASRRPGGTKLRGRTNGQARVPAAGTGAGESQRPDAGAYAEGGLAARCALLGSGRGRHDATRVLGAPSGVGSRRPARPRGRATPSRGRHRADPLVSRRDMHARRRLRELQDLLHGRLVGGLGAQSSAYRPLEARTRPLRGQPALARSKRSPPTSRRRGAPTGGDERSPARRRTRGSPRGVGSRSTRPRDATGHARRP